MLLCDSFSLLKSTDQAVYTGTEETIQKIQLQEPGDAASAAVQTQPKQAVA